MPFFLLSIWLHQVSVAVHGLLVSVWGIPFPDQGWNLGPLHWECGVLTTGPPRQSLVPFSSFRPQLTCGLPSDVSSIASPHPTSSLPPCWSLPGTSNLPSPHLPVCLPSVSYLSPSVTVRTTWKACLFITGVHRHSVQRPATKKRLFHEQISETMGRPSARVIKQKHPPCSAKE